MRNILFLVSQPRAGSTLTQKILGSHPEIHTQSEPWILLHPLHALKQHNIQATYAHALYRNALSDFIETLPGGRARYTHSIARTYYGLYESVCEKEGAAIFLDKTPRYYLILDELREYFPEAKIIILYRNPLAVLNSIISTWMEEGLFRLHGFKQDLFQAPRILLDQLRNPGPNTHTLYFENLLAKPQETTAELCEFTGIDFRPEMLKNFSSVNDNKWLFGDKTGREQFREISSSQIDSWRRSLADPQIWRLLNDYFEYLGVSFFNDYGYSGESIQNTLRETRPDETVLSTTLSLATLTSSDRDPLIHINYLRDKLKARTKELNQVKRDSRERETALEKKLGIALENVEKLRREVLELSSRATTLQEICDKFVGDKKGRRE